ncbi:NAD(P)H-hydrate dehydratase [Patescibacteria group bacterium]|nr:NAD(P)H-hydrate dehydratase [Patescibacteria group bacterium]
MTKKIQALEFALAQLSLPKSNSHKGQNGKLLIIGGSELFHAASKWSLDVASKIVDMVFYSSVPSNNKLINEAKEKFWNGIVISRKQIKNYIDEADAVLIGPGMDRSFYTKRLINNLLKKYPNKRWVIDAGALQMLDVKLLNSNHIITPHHQEMVLLQKKNDLFNEVNYQANCFCLLKGQTDKIFKPQNPEEIEIEGGNAGMTKGGTGDVLAGLLAAFYCKSEALESCLVASYINKKSAEELYKKQGTFFNSSDLVEIIPEVLWQELEIARKQITR